MNVYMDDTRPGPSWSAIFEYDAWHTWVIVRSVENTKVLLEAGMVEDLSLDHDMGLRQLSGHDLVKWMVETGNWPTGIITIHSGNIVGAQNMKSLIDNATKHGLRDN